MLEIILLILGILVIRFIFKSAKFIIKIAVIGYLLFLLFKYKDIFLPG
ncbi:hypothetical protein [Leptotrichia sp. OH3620_COT-345]|nr:hypothetical protein [Leptotrichia sp. OH3620_COT-345]